MRIFNAIRDKLFGKAKEQPAKSEAPTQSEPQATVQVATQEETAPAEPVDVEAILEAAVKAKGIKLNWRVSIVDLMRALDLDSSLAARKELAVELKYDGTDADGSAEKNMWLHRALMKKLAENGGVIPKELL